MDNKNGVKNQILRAEISASQRKQAKDLAKSKRMTFSGWLGLLIESELDKNDQGDRK